MEYDNVDEAKKVFDHPENIELNGRILYIDYSTGNEMRTEDTGECPKQPSFLYLHI